MNSLQRIIMVTTLGAFPLAVYLMSKAEPQKIAELARGALKSDSGGQPQMALADLHRGIETRAREIQEIDVKILENRGKILRLEEDKKSVIKDLEDLEKRLTTTLHDARSEH